MLVCFPFVVETRLTSEDLGRLTVPLRSVSDHWRYLADQLKMTKYVSAIATKKENTDPIDCLRDLLGRWLKTEHPTLETLCQALQELKEIIGEGDVATVIERLKEKFLKANEVCESVA